MTKRNQFIPAKALKRSLSLTLALCLLLSMTPVLSLGATNDNIDIYQSYVVLVENNTADVAPSFGTDEPGIEFDVVVILNDSHDPAGSLYVSTARPSVERVYFKDGTRWRAVGSSNAINLDDYADYISSVSRAITVKVVSTTAGNSYVAFGSDSNEVAACAAGNSYDSSYVIELDRLRANFTSVAGSLDLYRSSVVAPRSPVYAASSANADATGAEFTVTIVSNSGAPAGNLYMASSRPSQDTFYYKMGSRWYPIGSNGAVDLDDATYVSATRSELIVKVVSTSPGTSDIAFGTERNNTIDFAQGRSGADDRKIIQFRVYEAEFTSIHGGIDVNQSTITSPRNSVFAAASASATAEGAEFTLTLYANSAFPANIFVASDRYQTDTFYYKSGNAWIEIGRMTDVNTSLSIPIDIITGGGYRNGGAGTTTQLSSSRRELLIKVVSTSVGTSQIAFGLDSANTLDFAMDWRGADQTRIIQQRRYAAEFISVTDPNAQRYTVMFNANGGTRTPEDQVKTRNTPLTLTTSVPTRSGYTFLGWSTVNSATTATYPPGGLFTTDMNTTLYAIWSNSSNYYPISVSENEVLYGAATATPNSALAGQAVNLTTIAYNGYIFDHWEALSSNVTINNPYSPTASLTMPAGNVSVRAVFRPVSSTGPINDFRATLISTGVKLSWSSPGGASGYRVFRSENAYDEGAALNDALITGTDFIDVNVRNNAIYYYSVRPVIREGKPNEGVPEELGPATPKLQVMTTGIVSPPVAPSSSATKSFILMKIDDSYLSVNGVREEVDPGRGTVPMLLNNRTMVPARAIVEAMGGTAGWQDATREVSLDCKQNSVRMWLDNPIITANGVSKVLDVAPASINGRTMVPLRGALENLNCVVDWLGDTNQIVIVFY